MQHSRKVTVYAQIGANQKEIYSTASTWGELQADLDRAGVSYSGMKVVVGENQNSLDSTAAVLLTSEFTLFLVPQKVKSGV